MKRSKLDQIDIKILRELQRNGRVTNQRLSELVGLSPRPCLERVRRLEANGIIDHYMAVLNAYRVTNLITVISEVTLKSQTDNYRATFERKMTTSPEVVECFWVSGQVDYIVRVLCANFEAYGDLIAGWLDEPTLGVARIVSSVVLRPVRNFSGYPLQELRDAR